MASYRVAYGQCESVHGNQAIVEIRKYGTAADQTTQFSLGPNGYTLTMEGPSDTHMLPGIYTKTVEVTTIWDDVTALNALLGNIASSEDGQYILEVKDQLTTDPFFVGALLPESLSIKDDATNVSVTLTATDGLALLKNTLYNNDGVAYTDHATFKQHIENVQEKLLTWDRLEELFTDDPSQARLNLGMNATSVDDADYTGHPPSRTTDGYERMRLHHRTFHKQNTDGVNEYYSAYDVLDSMAKTLGVCIGTWQLGLFFISPDSISEGLSYRRYAYNGTETTISSATGQVFTEPFDGTYLTKTNYKGANWTRSYSSPVGKALLTRVTQQAQGVIYSTQDAPNTTSFDADEIYLDGQDLTVRGSVRIQLDGDDTLSGPNRLYRFVPKVTLILGNDDATPKYLKNELQTSLTADQTAVLDEGTEQENVVNFFTIKTVGVSRRPYEWTTTANVYRDRGSLLDGRSFVLHDGKFDIDVVLPFDFTVNIHDTGRTEHNGLSVSIDLEAYDYEGNIDSDYLDDATVTFIETGVYRRNKDDVQQAESFRYRAKQDSGRTDIDHGSTLIGDRGASTYFGGIEIYDGSDWVNSSGWVTPDQSTSRTVNQMAVEEVCANHKEAKNVQRGTVVHDAETNFFIFGNRWQDMTTDEYFVPLRHVFTFTPQLSDVTLFQRGRTFSAVTVDIDKFVAPGITPFVKPTQNDYGSSELFVRTRTEGLAQIYHNDAREIAENWDITKVIDGATLEFYKTVTPDAIGSYYSYQRETKDATQKIVRRIFVNLGSRLAEDTDSGWTAIPTQPADDATFAQAEAILEEYIGTNAGNTSQMTAVISHKLVSIFDTLLDQHTGATAAYGLRKLRNGYSGNCIIVTRDGSSPGGQVIGFDANGDVDTASIISFCGLNNGFVSRWYDQSGNSNDLVQNTAADRPLIWNGSSIQTLNGKTAVVFSGGDHVIAQSNFDINPNVNELVTSFVGSIDDVSADRIACSQWNSGTANQVMEIIYKQPTDTIRWQHRYDNGTLATADSATITTGAQYIVVGRTINGTHEVLVDNTNSPGTVVSNTPNNQSGKFAIGARSTGLNKPFDGKIQEVVIWSRSTPLDDYDDISDLINDYYSSY